MEYYGDSIRHYWLVCPECGQRQDDDGLVLGCPGDHPAALLRTEYADREFHPVPGREDLFRYQGWLPVARTRPGAARTVVYRSTELARALGVPNLWIAFNGYWPERGAAFDTATFKDLEAHTVLGRMPDSGIILTVASSGNTGAAFAWACSQAEAPCLIVVPGKSLHRFRFLTPLNPCVSLVAIDDGDYPDAIDLAAAVSRVSPFYPEGGVKNVGRRDGLATVMLSAFEEMGRLPSHYFQAVGSGTGAIAVLEAAKRLRDVTCEGSLPRLMLCQNAPFTPIHEAWQLRRDSLIGRPADEFRTAIANVFADELTNWTPPYEVAGGVRDSLAESHGEVLTAGNDAARIGAAMFGELEGIDIEPAAGVAVACLREAASRGDIDNESTVLLNITGGGRLRLGHDHSLVATEPHLRLTRGSLSSAASVRQVTSLPGVLQAM